MNMAGDRAQGVLDRNPATRRLRCEPGGYTHGMELGTSIFLIAVGAILRFAVTETVQGIKLATVGLILMIVGIVGLAISIWLLSRARATAVPADRVVERDPYRDPYR